MRLIELDGEVIGEATEDTPAPVVSGMAIADRDELRERGANTGARAVVDDEAIDDDVVGALDVDAVRRRAVVRGDLDGGAIGDEGDRVAGGTGAAQVEALIVAVLNVHCVT